jgi:flagellar biogenesis protein FliO
MITTLHSFTLGLVDASAITTGPAGPNLSRYFIVCACLLAAIGALAFGFKKLVAGAIRTKAGRRSLQVLDILPLGGKQKLAVVRCYDRTFALGLGEKEVTLVAELDPVHHEDRSNAAPDAADRHDFVRALDQASTEAPVAPPRKRAGGLFRNGGVFG